MRPQFSRDGRKTQKQNIFHSTLNPDFQSWSRRTNLRFSILQEVTGKLFRVWIASCLFIHLCVGDHADALKTPSALQVEICTRRFHLLPHLWAAASRHLLYTLTTVPLWKSRSSILCYSLIIDATLNWRRVRVSTLKTHITRESVREGVREGERGSRNIVFAAGVHPFKWYT